MTRDDNKAIEAALLSAYGDAEPGREAVRRGKAERKMAVKPEDGRRTKATGRTSQFNVMMHPDLKKAIAMTAHQEGVAVTEWIERIAMANIPAALRPVLKRRGKGNA